MKRIPLSLFTFLFLLSGLCAAPTKTVWQIGEKNHSASELALSPDKYKEFLANDFGWEDRFYIIGLSSPQKDFPYVLPGPADHWGGTSYTAGIRTHVLNILFGMKEVPETDSWKLIIDLLDTHHEFPALFKITINGKSWKYALPKGSGKSIDGDYSQIKPHTIEIPLNSGVIRKGSNSIALTSLEGSWILFDDIRLMGPDNAELNEVNKSVYLRDVKAADFQTTSPVAQPLLVDIEHLSGHPLLEVKVDGKKILEQRLEKGRYILEAPMPVVKSPKTSHYIISADGAILDKGMIRRAPHNTITLADYIDTRMGTAHSRWMIAPGPWMPFSMVKLSPDNQDSGWQSGYDPSFESIGTFSHIHEWTMAGLGIMPANGPLKTEIGSQSSLVKDANSYRSAIDKTSEETKVGYYKVDLTDYQIKAELTATSRCGFQRYTYPQDKDARVMIDLKIPSEYDYQIVEGSIKQTGARRIEGFSKQLSKNVWSADADQNYTIYFVIEFNKDIKKFGGWHDHTLWETDTMTASYPQRFGCYAEFDTTDHPEVMVRSGISYVDMAGASNNLSNEIMEPFGWNFEAVRKHQSDSWNNILNRVRIYSNDYREKVRFYTNLYRAFCRNTFSDADRRWVDAAGNIQKLDDPDAVALGCDAFWNTFWNLNQVWNLIAPEWSSRWVKSQLAMYDANGWLAKGPSGMKYIPVMVAEHEIPLLVSTYQMGIRNYDAEKMFRAIVKMQTTPAQRVANGVAGNRDLETYLQHQYVPADKGRFSNTLEYSYDDWTVSQLAKALGKEEYYRTFSNRGNWWKNAINPATGYAQMRYSNGEWEKNFDPFKSGANHHYVEGNAWQLTFFCTSERSRTHRNYR
ncbi:glycoside hydrolase family 92 protein [Bacteroides thetaiotaomicron]|uniref:glycoside hydrolase domain-containing protein n=1 Tax=Bacteroides thetaiotaomicron TaxID=818 RepID=UPI0021656038|nr:glycoside hydrolase family 92 protein [Bacteroides thetaiotaomicron]